MLPFDGLVCSGQLYRLTDVPNIQIVATLKDNPFFPFLIDYLKTLRSDGTAML